METRHQFTEWSKSRTTRYVVLARNECEEADLVDEYVGMTVMKLRKGKQRSRDLPPSE